VAFWADSVLVVVLPRPALFEGNGFQLERRSLVAIFIDLREIFGKKSVTTPETFILSHVRKFMGDQSGIMTARLTHEESVSCGKAVGHLGDKAKCLGRASQGIINGVLAAYVNKGATPLWRGAFWGGLIGLLLGVLAGISTHAFPASLIPSAILGLGCGLATAKAKR